jgi:hypothetical protein
MIMIVASVILYVWFIVASLGHVHTGPVVRIADGALASVGDQIMCTRNDHAVEAGEPGRSLANGDLLRIDAITPAGLMVRRALDADPVTGRRRWTDRQFLYAHFQDAELGYAVTDHAAQGRTVHTGMALITGTEDRQHAYVALTRGTNDNTAYVYTQPPGRADLAPGPRPAPELARYDRLARQAGAPGASADKTVGEDAARDPVGVLAEVLGRVGQQLSASQAREQALANADHMAILHAIWTAETSLARQHRYQELLAAALPPQYRQEPSHKAQWLWRTLRGAELAGLDARQALADAVGQRGLTGVRDIHAVIDARIRRSVGALAPVPAPSWSAQLPEITDPERRAYAAQIAQLMDARKQRIGEHAVTIAADWAVSGLGPLPEGPAARRHWQHRAASVSAYRELSGYQDPADPIGPEPATGSPDLRAAWHEALAALGPAGGPDVRGMTDGLLIRLRDTYLIETAWAPPWVGDQLRQARTGARDARLTALRITAEAATLLRGDERDLSAEQQALADSYHAMHGGYRQSETALAQTMNDRTEWEQATRQQRQLAVAADAELRRRHPGQHWSPLRSAEPEIENVEDAAPASPRDIDEAISLIEDLVARHREFLDKLAELQTRMNPAEDPGHEHRRQAFPLSAAPRVTPILQPPKPEMQPSPWTLQRLADREADREAAD